MLSIAVKISSQEALYQRYFKLGKYGGVFVKTEEEMDLDTPVLVKLTLAVDGEEQVYENLNGKIAWMNFKATTARPKGIGIIFLDEGAEDANKQMNVLLGQLVHSQKPTFML